MSTAAARAVSPGGADDSAGADVDAPRWRRMEPDERRRQILLAAVHHFGDRGYADVAVAQIARDAGVTRALVNHYFGTKRELYLASVQAMLFVPPVDEFLAPRGTRTERIRSAVDWLMDVVETHGHTWLAMAGAGGAVVDPEVQALLDEADDKAADMVLEAIGFAGPAERRAAVHGVVRSFSGLVKSISRELIERQTLTSAEVRELLVASLHAALDTVAPVDE